MWKLSLLFLAAALVRGSNIEGFTIHAKNGQPLTGVELMLMPSAPGGQAVKTRSDDNGAFSFQDVKAGEYRIKVRRRGFLETEFGAHGLDERGATLSVLGTVRIKVELSPAALIAGSVRNLDGELVEDVSVVVIRAGEQSKTDTATTDDRGQYRFSKLPEGRYIIAAYGTNGLWRAPMIPSKTGREEIDVKTFFPGVVSPQLATILEVKPGDQISGIDITLQRNAYLSVSGHVSKEVITAELVWNLKLMEEQSSPSLWYGQRKIIQFGVEPGSYQLSIEDVEHNLAACKSLELRTRDEMDLSFELTTVTQLQNNCPGWQPTSQSDLKFLRWASSPRP